MTDVYEVTTMLGGTEVLAGRIYRTRTSGAFEYDTAYLQRRDAFALAPALGLFPGAQPLFPSNPFSDSAPDTWGRKVQRRLAGHALDELTLMFGVNDESRQGATRFWLDGVALAAGDGVPVETELAEILRVADQIERNERTIDNTAVRRLFRATGSLGGARPKANVTRGAELWLAKFPKPIGDDWNVMAWEAALLDGMDAAGITVPVHTTLRFQVEGAERTVLLVRRFDRGAFGERIPYISAMTAVEAFDGAGGEWADLVDFTQIAGGDSRELWRRGAFGALIGNVDDHLRNHGFLRRGTAWTVAPAFDVNPTPQVDGNTHQLALFGKHDHDASAFFTADSLELFGMSCVNAREFATALHPIISDLPRRARVHGADPHSIDVMQPRMNGALQLLSELRAG